MNTESELVMKFENTLLTHRLSKDADLLTRIQRLQHELKLVEETLQSEELAKNFLHLCQNLESSAREVADEFSTRTIASVFDHISPDVYSSLEKVRAITERLLEDVGIPIAHAPVAARPEKVRVTAAQVAQEKQRTIRK